MGEVIRDKYRGRGVGFVQTGVFGPASRRLPMPGFSRCCEEIAWRALFWVGILPAAGAVIRRNIADPTPSRCAAPTPAAPASCSWCRPPYLWLTVTALMVAGAQGGVFAVQF